MPDTSLDEEGDSYIGQYRYGTFHGLGIYKSKEFRYEGEFENN